jgi:hypothetical protein
MFPVQHFWPVVFTNFDQVIPFAFFSVVQQPNSSLGHPLLRFLDHHTHTHTHTHTLCGILKVGSARLKGRYIHNTQPAQETDIHTLSGIRTHRPSNRATVALLMSNLIKNLNTLIFRIQSNVYCATFGAAL